MTRVDLVGIGHSYDGVADAVRDIELHLGDGAITALLGPSGCGKTTLLKIVAGLLTPTRGDVRFDGRSVRVVQAHDRGAVMVFQNHLLFPYLNVFDNVAFGLKMQRRPRAEIAQRVTRILERVHLDGFGARLPRELSGGQQQRVALARALVVAPRVLLLDEPLSNLDAHLREEMRRLIRDLQRELGITTLVVTHDQEQAVLLADEIGLMLDGRLLQIGAPESFYERPSSRRVATFFGGRNFLPGIKRGRCVETAIGSLVVGDRPVPDGPVCATIRPEQVQVFAMSDAPTSEVGGDLRGGGGPLRWGATSEVEGAFVGTIVERRFAGTHGRLVIAVSADTGPAWHCTAMVSTAAVRSFAVGAQAAVRLPAESVWLMSEDG